MRRICAFMVLVLLATSCSLFQSRRDVLARIGKDVLYKSEVAKLVPPGTTPEDSAYMVDQYVQSWALARLKTLKAMEQLTPDELAETVSQCHTATMNILLGQCYAGAFVAPLQDEGRIITAACAASQMSWSCKERPYDEFVYHWICAIAQHDEQGLPVSSDQDGEGRITMQEAYDYARQHDRRPETPSLTAHPTTMARQWSFGRIGIENDIDEARIEHLPPAAKPLHDLQGRRR